MNAEIPPQTPVKASFSGEGAVIYLIGTAGHPNYGDELITATWLRYLAEELPDAEVWLDTPRPGQAAVLLGGLHPGLRTVDTLYHACWNAPRRDPDETLEFGAQVVEDPGLIPREATGVEDLARVDLVHILGGGYINRLWPDYLALVGAARAVGNKYGAGVALTGAGLTPLVEGSDVAMSKLLADFDVVDVRDEPSEAAFASNVPQLTMSGDDALLGLDNPKVFGTEGATPTMLCLQSDLLEVPLEVLADYVVRTLRSWGVDQDPVTLVECLPPSDTKVVALLQPHLPQLDVLPFSALWRAGFPAAPGQRWLSTRFHPHLLAAAAGAWGVALPISQSYYRTKHDSLIQL
ncbi:MAG TPA: polysaccharide pyruvyl transferase family protein, partial [Actinomycetes bacterium]|nr:polysaccharide pyruvyl transferase family protein [Actinomycetes bacterium]